MPNTTLPRGLRACDRSRIRRDHYQYVKVWRGDEQVGAFNGRIAMASSGISGRPGQAVQGESDESFHTLEAPRGADIEQGDEIWAGDARYRVVAMDHFADDKAMALLSKLQ